MNSHSVIQFSTTDNDVCKCMYTYNYIYLCFWLVKFNEYIFLLLVKRSYNEWHHWFHYSNNDATLFFSHAFCINVQIDCYMNSLRVRTQYKIKHTFLNNSLHSSQLYQILIMSIFCLNGKELPCIAISFIIIISGWNSDILSKVPLESEYRANVVPKIHNPHFVPEISRISLFQNGFEVQSGPSRDCCSEILNGIEIFSKDAHHFNYGLQSYKLL